MQAMYNLTRLDEAISGAATLPALQALYNVHIPTRYNDISGPNSTLYCSATVFFVIGFLIRDRQAAERVCGVSANQSDRTSFVLNAGSAPRALQRILASGNDYVGLLTATGGDLGHTCIFASYGLTSASRTWGFYQSNATNMRRLQFPAFSVSPTYNATIDPPVGNRNRVAMNRAAFSTFLPALTQANGVPELGTNQTTSWALDVVSFRGATVLGGTTR
jgi:hypothetical protein